MNKRDKTIIGTAALALTAIILLLLKRKQTKMREKLDMIAEEGYEFAEDVLFPLEINLSNKLRSVFNR